MGNKLIVAVSTDEFNMQKGKKTLIPYEQRAEIIASIKYVDYVIPETSWEQKINDIQKYDIDTSSCVFVTDTLGDILEANKLGIKTIAVDFGYHERARLERGNPFAIVSDFKEIRKIIEQLDLN